MLSHVDKENLPTMVDVSDKAVTRRTAVARATVIFPEEFSKDNLVNRQETFHTKKGPVLDTAIIAGVQAAKQTHSLLPFCHPIPLEDCRISFEWTEGDKLIIDCSVRATHKTGVEMEALTGVTVAALTVYDMCKALSHQIRISDVRLISKAGGKRDFGE